MCLNICYLWDLFQPPWRRPMTRILLVCFESLPSYFRIISRVINRSGQTFNTLWIKSHWLASHIHHKISILTLLTCFDNCNYIWTAISFITICFIRKYQFNTLLGVSNGCWNPFLITFWFMYTIDLLMVLVQYDNVLAYYIYATVSIFVDYLKMISCLGKFNMLITWEGGCIMFWTNWTSVFLEN